MSAAHRRDFLIDCCAANGPKGAQRKPGFGRRRNESRFIFRAAVNRSASKKTKLSLLFLLSLPAAFVQGAAPILVTVDNFRRAETDTYLAKFEKQGGFGKFSHERELAAMTQVLLKRRFELARDVRVEQPDADFLVQRKRARVEIR